MSGRRLAAAAVVAAVLVLAGASTPAHACNEPVVAVSPKEARAGEIVRWTITSIERGAAYDVRFGGRSVGSGSSPSDGSHSGEFTMPDLGDEDVRGISVAASVEHDDGSWSSYTQVHYKAPAPPPPAEQPKQEPPAEEPAPSAQQPQHSEPAPQPSPTDAPAGGPAARPDAERRPAKRPSRTGSSAPRERSADSGTGVPERRLGVAEPPVVVAAGAAAHEPSAAARQRRAAGRSARRSETRTAIPAVAPRLDPRFEAAPGVLPAAEPATESIDVSVVGIAGAVLLATGIGLLLILRRPRFGDVAVAVAPPDTPSAPTASGPDDLEAELQELLAEHHAREAARERV